MSITQDTAIGVRVKWVVFFSNVGCYHFTSAYARLTFRIRAHNLSLRGSLGGDRCLRRLTRVRFYATLSWICLRGHSFSNILVWFHDTFLQCRPRLHERQWRRRFLCLFLGCDMVYRQWPHQAMEHVERTFFSLRGWLRRRGGGGIWRRKTMTILQVEDAGSAFASWQRPFVSGLLRQTKFFLAPTLAIWRRVVGKFFGIDDGESLRWPHQALGRCLPKIFLRSRSLSAIPWRDQLPNPLRHHWYPAPWAKPATHEVEFQHCRWRLCSGSARLKDQEHAQNAGNKSVWWGNRGSRRQFDLRMMICWRPLLSCVSFPRKSSLAACSQNLFPALLPQRHSLEMAWH